MFLSNKYTRLYHILIEKSRQMSFPIYEKHHILPKSLGGENKPDNIVNVSPRIHFILHRLLPKMVDGPSKTKMNYALWRMMHPQSKHHSRIYVITSRLYESLKNEIRLEVKMNNPMKRPEVVNKLIGQKRPKQSDHMKTWSVEYWKNNPRRKTESFCINCNNAFIHKKVGQKFCSGSCRNFHMWKTKRAHKEPVSSRLGNKVD